MIFERMEDTKTELVVTVFPSRSHVTPPSYEFQVLLGDTVATPPSCYAVSGWL
jgi:hypothetical protein